MLILFFTIDATEDGLNYMIWWTIPVEHYIYLFMGKYIKDISTLLNLDLGEYRKNRTQEDWLRKLTKNN